MVDGKDMNKTAHIAGNLKTVSIEGKSKKKLQYSHLTLFIAGFLFLVALDCGSILTASYSTVQKS